MALRDSHYQPLNSNPKQNKILDESCSSTTEKEDETLYKFSIEKEILVKVDNENWGYLFKEENTLPYNWTKYFADLLSKYFPNCCINFKRRKMYPQNSTYIAKFWFYCSTAGCSLDSTTQLFKNRDLIVQNKNTSLSHTKGVYKSFLSRFVRGKDRVKLGESVSELSIPSKEFHKRLANLDENTFSSGNLRDTPMSKNVIKQCAYEYREASLEDKMLLSSVHMNIEKHLWKTKMLSEVFNFYNRNSVKKLSPNLHQVSYNFFSINPKDIELYHKMSSSHSLLVDATGSIATKLTDKEIFYFAFISYDRSIQTEPVPHLELLTDLSSTDTLKFIFMRFLEDEMKRFNYISFSVPLL